MVDVRINLNVYACMYVCGVYTALRLRYTGFALLQLQPGAEVQTPPFTADGAVLPS